MSKILYFYSNPSPNGRVAIAGLIKDRKIYIGLAHCSPKDQFLKSMARKISAGRAEKAAQKNNDELNSNQFILTISSKESAAQQFNKFCTFICQTKQYEV